MVKLTQNIEHQGIVTKVDEKNIEVKIEAASACAQCHVKGACLASDMAEKIIDVNRDKAQVSKGQAVTVALEQSLGFQALLLGYLLPFIITLTALIVILNVTQREVVAGIAAIVILIPYYGILYLTRHRIKKNFQFKLKL